MNDWSRSETKQLAKASEMAKVTVTAFVEEDIKEGLKALADVERRSMSQMMALLTQYSGQFLRQKLKPAFYRCI